MAQDLFHLLLQGQVQGQVHMLAGLRLLQIDGAEDGAGGVAVLDHLAVLAVQVVFKGVLNAVLAHHGVVCVFQQGVFLKLLLGHQAHVAQDMGRVLGAVVPDVGPLHLDAGELVLHDGGDQAGAGVLNKHVIGGVDGVAHVDGIADAGDDAHLLGGIAVVDVVSGAHVAHQLHRRGVGGQIVALILEIGVEHGPLDLRHVGIVLKGRRPGDGQIVGVLVAIALHQPHQLQDNRVGIVVGEELHVVDLQVIAFLVADQHAAIPVQDVAPGRRNGALGAGDLVGLVIVPLPFYDLQLIQEVEIDHQDGDQKRGHGSNSSGFYKFVHSGSFPKSLPTERR